MSCKQNQFALCSCQLSTSQSENTSTYQKSMQTHLFKQFILKNELPKSPNDVQYAEILNKLLSNLPQKINIHDNLQNIVLVDGDNSIHEYGQFFQIVLRDTFKLYLILKSIPNQINHFKVLKKICEICDNDNLNNNILVRIANTLQGSYQDKKSSIMSAFLKGQLEKQQNKLFKHLINFYEIKKVVGGAFIAAYNQNTQFAASQWYSQFSSVLLADSAVMQQLAEEEIFLYPKNFDSTFWDIFHKYIIGSEKLPKKLIEKMLTSGLIQKNFDKLKTLISDILKPFKQQQQILKTVILDIIDNVAQQTNLQQKISTPFSNTKLPLLCKAVILLRKGQINSLYDFQQLLQYLDIEKSKLQTYIESSFSEILHYTIKSEENFQNEIRVYMQILIYMSCKLDHRTKRQIWQSSWKRFQKLGLFSQISSTNEHLHLITILSEFVNCILDEYSYLSLTTQLDIQTDQLKNKQKIALEQIVASQGKITSQRVKTIVNWLGNFYNAGAIFRDMVSFSSKQSTFIYNGSKNKNPNIRTLFSTGQIVVAGQYFKLNQNQLFLRDFLLVDDLIQIFEKSFRKVHQPTQNFFFGKRQKFIELSFYMQVALYNMFNGQNGRINQIVTQIQMTFEENNQQNTLSQLLNSYPSIKTKLKDWFPKSQDKKNSVNGQENERKQKMAEIKRRKFQQIKEKQRKASMLKNMENNEEKQIQMDVDLCIICHEPSRDNDYLYSFGCASQNYIYQYLFHTDNPQSNINICFHLIHQSCFAQKYSQIKYYPCPLCKAVFNCIIPHRIQERIADNILNRNSYWRLRLEALLAIQQKQHSCSSYEFFFNFLIYSQVILSALTNPREQLKRKKTIQVIYSIMSYGYKMKQFNLDSLIENFRILFESKSTYVYEAKKNAILQIIASIKRQSVQLNYEPVLLCPLTVQYDGNSKLNEYISNSPKSTKNEIKNLLHFINLPQNAEQFNSLSKQVCSNCLKNQVLWQCLICRLRSCLFCCNLANHITHTHKYAKGGQILILDYETCSLHILSRHQKIVKNCLYTNEFQQKWTSNSANARSFKLKEDVLEQVYNVMLKNEMQWNNINSVSGLQAWN